MLKKAYLEISNVCNMSCSFCHGTTRAKRMMSVEEFTHAAVQIRPFCEYLYFHLLGEPLLHPQLSRFFEIADELGFKVIITTNGTLLRERSELLLSAGALYKVSISLHSFEANDTDIALREYLFDCFEFARRSSERGVICAMRLWNKGGADEKNEEILSCMHEFFSCDWTESRSGYKITDRVYLEWGEHFEWPDMNARDMGGNISCWGLRDQIGILSDGTVVPCCLDSEGDIALGNIFETPLFDILNSDRAQSLKRSFECRRVTEPLCLRCGYAHQKMY